MKHEMTETEKQEYRQEEYKEYIRKYRANPKERQMLRKWVASGHSVYESPGSRYLCDQYPPLDYLETYRQDCRIEQELQGKRAEEQEAYLRSWMGYDEPESLKPDKERKNIAELEHELFYLWDFICSKGLWDEAEKHLEAHKDDEIPFGREE